jgi:hypothetical protein
MEHEIVVEGFVLQVEVTHCVNEPPCPDSWNSDWDAQGERELEFKLLSAICYDDNGVRMTSSSQWSTASLAYHYRKQIELALWYEIDARKRRQGRWAA